MPAEPDLAATALALHDRYVGGDPTASAAIAELLLPPLVQHLSSLPFAGGDRQLAETAAADALLDYLRRPQQYDPARLPLLSYLRMAARGDLRNYLRKERSASARSGLGQIVELDALDGEQEIADAALPDIAALVIDHASPAWELLAALLPDPVDYECALLMLENVRATHEYAVVLGLTELPPAAQASAVKRHKDRLKKRLQRHIRRTDLEANE